MSTDEIIDLLTLMASYDRRKVGEADVAAWYAAVSDLPFGDARDAVIGHYSASTDWLMPAHIRQRVKRIREDRLARTPLPAPPSELADDPERYRKALAANVGRIADGMTVRKALAGPLPGEPPAEWQKARDAIRPADPVKRDPREVAREQAEEARAKRQGLEHGEGAA